MGRVAQNIPEKINGFGKGGVYFGVYELVFSARFACRRKKKPKGIEFQELMEVRQALQFHWSRHWLPLLPLAKDLVHFAYPK